MPCAARQPGSSPSGAWDRRFAPAARESALVAWTLVQADGTASEAVDLDGVKARLASGEHFWLDVGHPASDELDALGDVLELHRLARDDLGAFGQRAKADDYPGDDCVDLDEAVSASCVAPNKTSNVWPG